MKYKNWCELLAYTLVIIGAINWGLVGSINFDLVRSIYGEYSTVSRIIYGLVGLSGIYLAITKVINLLKSEAD